MNVTATPTIGARPRLACRWCGRVFVECRGATWWRYVCDICRGVETSTGYRQAPPPDREAKLRSIGRWKTTA